MKRIVIFLFICIIHYKPLKSQDNIMSSILDAQNRKYKNNYEKLNAYRELDSVIAFATLNKKIVLQEDSLNNFYQEFSYLHAYAGNYEQAKKNMNRYLLFHILNPARSYFYDRFNTFNPMTLDYLLDSIANTYQIIILNEGHHIPQNRVTTQVLLPLLYKKGFRYLALEALSEQDSFINKRGFALSGISSEGYSFIDEPCYANMIREAVKTGIKLIPYEYYSSNFEDRERGQAQNIVERILKKDKKAKIIIHCGLGHGSSNPHFKMMGYYLKKMTNKKMLFIDQWMLGSNKDTLFESPDYTYANSKYTFKEPVIFINKNNNKIWKLNNNFGDLPVFLPNSNDIHGRPSWLYFGEKKIVHIDDIDYRNHSFPLLVQAFRVEEGILSVPFDQFEIEYMSQKKCLFLDKGDYIIQMLDKKGNSLFNKNITVK